MTLLATHHKETVVQERSWLSLVLLYTHSSVEEFARVLADALEERHDHCRVRRHGDTGASARELWSLSAALLQDADLVMLLIDEPWGKGKERDCRALLKSLRPLIDKKATIFPIYCGDDAQIRSPACLEPLRLARGMHLDEGVCQRSEVPEQLLTEIHRQLKGQAQNIQFDDTPETAVALMRGLLLAAMVIILLVVVLMGAPELAT